MESGARPGACGITAFALRFQYGVPCCGSSSQRLQTPLIKEYTLVILGILLQVKGCSLIKGLWSLWVRMPRHFLIRTDVSDNSNTLR